MAVSRSRLARLVVAVTCLVGGLMLSACATVAAPPPVPASQPLGLPDFHKIVVDAAHSRVFYSGGTQTSTEGGRATVLVTTTTGAVVKRLTGLPSAWGMALSPATHHLFVALPAVRKIAVIDTATLAVVAMVPAPADAVPTWLAVAGGLLWIGSPYPNEVPEQNKVLLTLNPANLASGMRWAPGLSEWSGGVPELTSPGESGNLLAAVTDPSRDAGYVYLFRTSETALTQVGRPYAMSYFSNGVTFTPDGRYLAAVQQGGPAVRLLTSNMTISGEYNTAGPATPNPFFGCDRTGFATAAGVYSADSRTFIGGATASFFPSDSARPTSVTSVAGCLMPFGLAVDPTGMHVFAAVDEPTGLSLVTLPGPASPLAPRLALPPLGLQTVAGMLVDPVHQHIFVAPGETGDELAVLDFQGRLVKLIPDLYGAEQLALSTKLNKLYVGLSTATDVAEIDTATLSVTRMFPTGDEVGSVALAGGRVWSTVDVDLASLDPTQPHPQWVSTHIELNGGSFASPGETKNLLMIQGAVRPGPVAVFKVSGSAVTQTARGQNETATPVFSPDDTVFYAADGNCGRAICTHNLSDLSRTGLFGGFDAPPAIPVGLSPDGRTITIISMAANSSYLLEKFNTATGTLLATAPGENANEAAFSPDQRTIYSITGGDDSGNHPPQLHLLAAL